MKIDLMVVIGRKERKKTSSTRCSVGLVRRLGCRDGVDEFGKRKWGSISNKEILRSGMQPLLVLVVVVWVAIVVVIIVVLQ
jgi:hypothetical protein